MQKNGRSSLARSLPEGLARCLSYSYTFTAGLAQAQIITLWFDPTVSQAI
jgi:hypothetical protein